MTEYWVNLLIGVLVILFIFLAIYAWNNDKIKPYIERFILNVLKPFLKRVIINLITEIELEYEKIKGAGVEKMTELILAVTNYIPKPLRSFISEDEIRKLCQSVFDKIKDVLPELVEKLKNAK